MTKLVVLSSTERERFDSPPKFTSDERAVYFSLTNEVMEMIKPLHTSTSKVGFLLQFGYFKSHAKFCRSYLCLL